MHDIILCYIYIIAPCGSLHCTHWGLPAVAPGPRDTAVGSLLTLQLLLRDARGKVCPTTQPICLPGPQRSRLWDPVQLGSRFVLRDCGPIKRGGGGGGSSFSK